MNQSIERDSVKQWLPRNKQAAFVVRKASEANLHTPPPKLEPTFAPSQAEKVKLYCLGLRKNIESVLEWKRNRPNRLERRRAQDAQRAAANKRALEHHRKNQQFTLERIKNHEHNPYARGNIR